MLSCHTWANLKLWFWKISLKDQSGVYLSLKFHPFVQVLMRTTKKIRKSLSKSYLEFRGFWFQFHIRWTETSGMFLYFAFSCSWAALQSSSRISVFVWGDASDTNIFGSYTKNVKSTCTFVCTSTLLGTLWHHFHPLTNIFFTFRKF